eukprot:863398-Amphidinium_carterae.2
MEGDQPRHIIWGGIERVDSTASSSAESRAEFLSRHRRSTKTIDFRDTSPLTPTVSLSVGPVDLSMCRAAGSPSASCSGRRGKHAKQTLVEYSGADNYYITASSTRERQKASRDSWTAFGKQAAEESPSKLYKWVRGTTKVWDLAVQTDGGWASPGAVARGELHAWSQLWKTKNAERPLVRQPFREPPTRALGSLWEVLACLMKAIGALEIFFQFCEQQGQWPDELWELLYLQLPREGATHAGQRRPIALLPMIYGIWAAWQKHRITDWRSTCADRGETPVGRGALDEAFTLAREAETATAKAESFAAVFLDCSKCYERVDLSLHLVSELKVSVRKYVGTTWYCQRPAKAVPTSYGRFLRLSNVYWKHLLTPTHAVWNAEKHGTVWVWISMARKAAELELTLKGGIKADPQVTLDLYTIRAWQRALLQQQPWPPTADEWLRADFGRRGRGPPHHLKSLCQRKGWAPEQQGFITPRGSITWNDADYYVVMAATTRSCIK